MLTNRISWIKRRRIRRASLLSCLRAHQRRITNPAPLTSQFSDRRLTRTSWNRAESLPVTVKETIGIQVKNLWMSTTISKSQSLAARNLITLTKCKSCRTWRRKITNRSSKTWRIGMRAWRLSRRSSVSSKSSKMPRTLANLQQEVARGPNGPE